MKIKLIKKDKELSKKDYNLFKTFIEYLHQEYPLKGSLVINFLPKRIGQMTTGSSKWDAKIIKILTKNRMNRDILRTLAHEWIHQYQRYVLNRELGSDIGGLNEDEANALSGKLVKMFERNFPNLEELSYE